MERGSSVLSRKIRPYSSPVNEQEEVLFLLTFDTLS